MRRHELSEAQWNKIKDLLPPERKPQGGRPAKSNREMLNAIVYWLNTGIPWRDLPERFGPWQSVYSRFRAWTKAGVWENVLAQLIHQDIIDGTTLMPAVVKKGRQRVKGSQPGRINHESSCGNRWAWESAAFFAFSWKPK